MRPAVYDFLRSFSKLYMILVLIIFALGAVGSGFLLKFAISGITFTSPVSLVGYSTQTHFLGYVFDSSGSPVSYTARLVLVNGSTVTYSGVGEINVSFPPEARALTINTSYRGFFTVTSGQSVVIDTSQFYINGQTPVGMPSGPNSVAYVVLVATGGQSYGSPQKLVMIGFNVTGQEVEPLSFGVEVQGKNVSVNGFGVTTVTAEREIRAQVTVSGLHTVATVPDSVPSTFATVAYTAFGLMVGLMSAIFPLVSLYSTLLNVVRSIESGSLKFLIAQPVKRYQVVLNRYLASLLVIIVVATVFGVVIFAESAAVLMPYGVSISPSSVLGFVLAIALPQAAYLSLLLLIASLVSRGWQFSLASFSAYVLVFYVIPFTVTILQFESSIMGFGARSTSYDWLYYIGFGGLTSYIFSTISGTSGLLSTSLPLPAVIADLLAWIIVPLLLAIYKFNRRDF